MGKGNRNRKARSSLRSPQISNKQYELIRKEVDKQLLEADRQYSVNFAAGVLWALHVEFGFGQARLRRMWDAYTRVHDELKTYYELDDNTDTCFVCKEKLKQIGVDVDAWDAE